MDNSSNLSVPQAGQIIHPGSPINILSNKIFTGCNLYHTSTVIRLRVDFGKLTEETSALAGPKFAASFLDRFLGLKSLVPKNGLKDDFITQLTSPEGVDFREVLLQAILAVENTIAFAMHDLNTITYAAIEKHKNHTVLIWECSNPTLSLHAAEVGLLGLIDLLPRRYYTQQPETSVSFDSAIKEIHEYREVPADVDVLKLNYPSGSNGRIPIAIVAGDKGTGATARTLDMILRGAGRSVALALHSRAFVNGESAELSEVQQAQAPLVLLLDPTVETLVSTVSPRQAARHGLLIDQCSLSVIMDKVLEENTRLFHAGLDIVIRATTNCFVVGAGNIMALNRLQELGAKNLILVSEHHNDPTLQAHLNAGHTAVTTMWHGQAIRIVLLSGTEHLASFQLDAGSSRGGRARKRRLKMGKMFAIAAAFGLGFSGSEIETAFQNAPAIVPDAAGLE